MAADQVQLKGFQFGIGYPNVGKLSKTSVYAIHDSALTERFLNDRARRTDTIKSFARDRETNSASCDRINLVKVEPSTTQFNHLARQ